MGKNKKSNYSIFLMEYALSRKYLIYYFITISIIFIISIIMIKRPLYQAEIIDILSSPKGLNIEVFMNKLIIFLALLLLNYLLNYFKILISQIISEKIAYDLLNSINEKIGMINCTYFLKKSFNDIQVIINKDIEIVKKFGISNLINLVSNVIILIIVIPFMFIIDNRITIINVALISLIPVFSKFLGKHIECVSKEILVLYRQLLSVLEDNFTNWRNTKLFSKYKYIIARFQPVVFKYQKQVIKRDSIYTLNYIITTFLQISGTASIWIIGVKNIIEGSMTIGIIMALMNYQSMIVGPILEITNFYNEYHTAKESLNNIYSFFNENDENLESGFFVKDICNIEICNLKFAYDKNEILNIKNINFKKGNLYAIKGSSGQGKSTFMDILSGNIDNYKGDIIIDGLNLKDINISSYRLKISYLMQFPSFYLDYFKNNLNHFSGDKYMKMFNVDAEIYNKKIDSKNKNLSGGQYKMLDFIRNVNKDSSLLLLDEPTAGMDRINKKILLDEIKKISINKIIIMSTHDEEELIMADQVYELVDGDFRY